jgi:hypothetical protein
MKSKFYPRRHHYDPPALDNDMQHQHEALLQDGVAGRSRELQCGKLPGTAAKVPEALGRNDAPLAAALGARVPLASRRAEQP